MGDSPVSCEIDNLDPARYRIALLATLWCVPACASFAQYRSIIRFFPVAALRLRVLTHHY
jgi:hypothetical protein